MHGKDVPVLARKVKAESIDFATIRTLGFRHAEALLKAWLSGGRREGDEWVARNPTRADDHPGSFKVNIRTGTWADFATGDKGGDLIALRAYLDGVSQLEAARRIADELGIELSAAPSGLTLEAYAAAKRLPVDFLRKLGLETIADPWGKQRDVLAIPYRKRDGSLHRNRLRVALGKPGDGAPRMFWDKREDKIGACLYGLDTLPAKGCPVILVEGESDAQTLWHHGFDAVGCPGAGSYAPARDDNELDGLDIIAFIEPDQGGEALIKQLGKSGHASRIKLAYLDDFKDVSEVHLRTPERFDDIIKAAIASAKPFKKPAKKKSANTSNGGEATISEIIVNMARAMATFFCGVDDVTYAAIEVDGHREVWPLHSKGFKRRLIRQYFQRAGKPPSNDNVNQALMTLDAIAAFDGEKQQVYIRRAYYEGKIYIDLCNDEWSAIEVDTNGWRIVESPPVYFIRRSSMLPLTKPVHGGSIDDLRPHLNVKSEDDFRLIVGWLLAALRPQGPYPILAAAGEAGTAKTSTAELARSLIDPNVADVKRPPKDERNLFIGASNSALLVYDNLSSIPLWFSDGLCVISTGGSYTHKTNYSDADETIFKVCSPVMITSVGDVIAQADLASRAIVVRLAVIDKSCRMEKDDFDKALKAALPYILGALLDGVVHGLNNIQHTKLDSLPRMADFAVWAQACEGRFWETGAIATAFNRNSGEAVEDVLEANPVALALRSWIEKQKMSLPWRGQVQALLTHLTSEAAENGFIDQHWPKTPQKLSREFERLGSALREVGIKIERLDRCKGKRSISIDLNA